MFTASSLINVFSQEVKKNKHFKLAMLFSANFALALLRRETCTLLRHKFLYAI